MYIKFINTGLVSSKMVCANDLDTKLYRYMLVRKIQPVTLRQQIEVRLWATLSERLFCKTSKAVDGNRLAKRARRPIS